MNRPFMYTLQLVMDDDTDNHVPIHLVTGSPNLFPFLHTKSPLDQLLQSRIDKPVLHGVRGREGREERGGGGGEERGREGGRAREQVHC